MKRAHSPSGLQYFMRKRYEQRFPRFQFQEPSETYGLIPKINFSQNNNIDCVQNNSDAQIFQNFGCKTRNSQSKEKKEESCILIGNTLKSLERRILKPRISYQPEISPAKRIRTQTKPIRKQQKFNGVYFEDERFSMDLEFQEKYANLRQYYNCINLSNGLFIKLNINYYRAHISKSNNGQLVKQVLKSRWWWFICENPKDQVNFLWESQRNDKFVGNLPQSQLEYVTHNGFEDMLPDTFNENLLFTKLLPNQLLKTIRNSDILINKTKKLLTQQQCQAILETVRIIEASNELKIHNHIENNTHLGSKKNLFINLKHHYLKNDLEVFHFIPVTYHIRCKQELDNFLFSNFNSNKIWIVKPGELTNRGSGIQIFSSVNEIYQLLKGNHFHRNGLNKTFIVQEYITTPLLYNSRKFDIRCFVLFTSINGQHKGYWYQEGYIRTSSKEFTLNNLNNKMIHLTNDAVQKNSDDYGKFEKGNKVSFEEFSRYVTVEKFTKIYQKMKQIALDQLMATAGLLDPLRRENTFELFGLDYMVDLDYRTLLIETNTNPCLEQTGPLLTVFMPQLIENVFRLVIDPLYPPPQFYSSRKFVYGDLNNKFELIFDQATINVQRLDVMIDTEL